MAILVGQDGTGWTNTAVSFGALGGSASWTEPAYTPVSDGAATTAYVHISDWGSATQAKVLVYNATTRVLLAQSGDILASGGTGLRSASITYTVSTSTAVILAVLPDAGYLQLTTNNTGATWVSYVDQMTYATPDDPIPAGTNGPNREFIIWLDGTTGSSNSNILGGKLAGFLLGKL